MLTVRTTIGPSRIHGHGLFAAEFIRKGEVVWQFDRRIDHVVPIDSFWWISPSERQKIFHYGYYNRVLERYVVSADGSRFINHSTTPNIITLSGEEDGEDIDLAAADIEEGEELTMDYRIFDGHAALKLGYASFGREADLPVVSW